MRYELEKFFSNPCEASGLLIAEAPTGYGKTYETIQAIYRYIEKGGKSFTVDTENTTISDGMHVYHYTFSGDSSHYQVLNISQPL